MVACDVVVNVVVEVICIAATPCTASKRSMPSTIIYSTIYLQGSLVRIAQPLISLADAVHNADTLLQPKISSICGALVWFTIHVSQWRNITYPVSFCLARSPFFPFCLPWKSVSGFRLVLRKEFTHTDLPPSTTNLSIWKNWLTVACLCS